MRADPGARCGIKLAQFRAEPRAAGKSVHSIKAVVGMWIKDHSPSRSMTNKGWRSKKSRSGGAQALLDANEEGGEWVAVGAETGRTPSTPSLDDGRIEQGEEGTILLDKRVNLKKSSAGGLIKAMRSR